MSFTNKVVIVTGASSGIGSATALQFSREGAAVVMVGRNEEKLKNVKRKCDAEGWPAFTIKADVSDEEETREIISTTIAEFGKIDVLVNNAAILRSGSLLDGSILDTYDEVMNTNLRGAVNLTSFATRYLMKSQGNIIFVSSIGAEKVINTDYNAYCMSKAALSHFSRATALELSPHGVRVNTITAGILKTDFLENIDMEMFEHDSVSNTFVNKFVDPEEVAKLILHVASDKARSATGSNYVIDSGKLLYL
ncbi:3-oxoacyl-[acyl-carrier-protein] reductase FabG-like [Zerene cesonia]|uniref:3-oxoacyl-[acyl-carrier-protein] reductase FabG-like n=1 Tax=Zerene cesonia TaxID=33412 RepID=UPI0018E552E7|nr:3-oxoacyl-[acyl-carrier-protein] reductase FabG-like [Zerene cesonia]